MSSKSFATAAHCLSCVRLGTTWTTGSAARRQTAEAADTVLITCSYVRGTHLSVIPNLIWCNNLPLPCLSFKQARTPQSMQLHACGK